MRAEFRDSGWVLDIADLMSSNFQQFLRRFLFVPYQLVVRQPRLLVRTLSTRNRPSGDEKGAKVLSPRHQSHGGTGEAGLNLTGSIRPFFPFQLSLRLFAFRLVPML